MADVQRLSSFLQIDPQAVESQQWSIILPSLLARAAEYESFKSRNVVLEVEIEQTNRDAEKRIAAASQQVSVAQKELGQLKNSSTLDSSRHDETAQQIQNFGRERQELNNRINNLITQNADLVEEKKQALSLLDRQSQAASRHEEEYKSLSARYKSLREDTATMEAQISEARSSNSSAQFKTTSLEQSLALAQKNVEYLTTELQTKSVQFSNYRKENNTLLTTVQKEADIAKSEAASAVHSLDLAQNRNQELTTNLEQHLVKVAELQEQLSRKEESFRNEMAAQSRLIDLHERRSRDAKSRIIQLEQSLESRGSHESEELADWIQRANTSEERCQELEKTLAQQKDELNALDKELDVANERLGTIDENHSSGLGLLSPSAQIVSKVQNSGMTLSQLYAEHLRTKQDLEHEKRKNAQIQTSFDALINELEARAPQLQQQREEYSHLQYELATMSEQLQAATDCNEVLTRDTKLAKILASDQDRELRAHEAQIIDLSRQVQKLLFEIEEQGFRTNPLSEAEVTALNRMLANRGKSNSAVDNLISDRLVLFKNIQDLQQQNQQQLKITRQLGAKMEADEEANRARMNDMENKALADANEVISTMTTQMQSMQVKMESYVRERDMFRGMLSQADARAGNISSMTIPGQDQERNPEVENMTNSMRELQKEYDIYKTESAKEHKNLLAQLTNANKERSDLTLRVSRLSSQLDLAEERHKMYSGAMDMMRKEVEESRKRTSQLQQNMAKQDQRGQQDAEELVELKAMLSSIRAENSNYKAEKQLWQSIEKRISDESESMRVERDRLTSLVANLQALQSERERTEKESTQRYSHQINVLENDLEITRARLQSEREEVRRMTFIRDQSNRESQDKIESLLKQVADAREAHAIANTEKLSQQNRVTELAAQMTAAEEKLSIFSKSPTSGAPSSTVSSDQQLQLDIADVRLQLENTKSDLTRAREEASKMQEIANAAEKALAEMNTAYDAYKNSQEAIVEANASENVRLTQRINDLTEQIDTVNQELANIHKVESIKQAAIQQEVDSLGSQVRSLREVEEKYTIANAFYQDDLRAQAEIAQEAQQNYENELMKHAEAAQALRTLRHDYNELRTEVLTLRTVSQSSEQRLLHETHSWQSQKDLYERELSDLRSRLTDLRRQNDLLHEQFETFTNQVASRPNNAESHNDGELETESVQEVIKYLRREKEIVEVSLELVQQENKRIKQQLGQTTKALDETQTSLALERQRVIYSSAQQMNDTGSQTRLQELSMIRESNSTLRAENESNVNKVRSLEAQLADTTQKMEPLEMQVRSLQADSFARSQEVELLTQDNERWRQRNQAILQKYERIDPEELQQLRDQAAGASGQLETLKASVNSLQEQVAEKEKNASTLQEQLSNQISKYEALMQQTRERIKKERTDAKKALASVQALTEQLEAQTAEIELLKWKVEQAEATASEQPSLESVNANVEELQAQIANSESDKQDKIAQHISELSELKATIEKLTQERDAAISSISIESNPEASSTQVELDKCRLELEKQKSNYKELRQAAKKNKDELVATTSNFDALKLELEALKSASENIVAEAVVTDNDEIQRRINAAVTEALSNQAKQVAVSSESSDTDLQKKIDEALAQQATVNEAETQKRIAEALSQKSPEFAENSGQMNNDQDVEALLAAKEEEYKARIRSITKERVDTLVESRLPKKLEAEKQKWLKDVEEEKNKLVAEKDAEMRDALKAMELKNNESLEARAANVRKESDMRNQLKLGMKDKKIAKLEQSLAEMTAAAKSSEEQASIVTDNGKSQDLFPDISEHSEGEPDDGQISGIETPNPTQGKTDGPTTRSRGGRGGRQQRGARRGGAQGTKRPRDDGGTTESEQPAKKAA